MPEKILGAAGGGGAWTVDANSPFTGQGQQSHTFNLDGEYDLVKLLVRQIKNVHGSEQFVRVFVEGDPDGYTTFDVGGTSSDFVDGYELGFISPNMEWIGEVVLAGRWDHRATWAGSLGTGDNDIIDEVPTAGFNWDDAASPLTTFEVAGDDGPIDVNIGVLGYELG